MEIAALVSGGVDSSVVVHMLKEAGYDPTIFYIRIGMEDKDGYIDCPAEEDIEITSYIAKNMVAGLNRFHCMTNIGKKLLVIRLIQLNGV